MSLGSQNSGRLWAGVFQRAEWGEASAGPVGQTVLSKPVL